MNNDVPSPIDLRTLPDALEWESTAMQKRPCRTEFFEAFAKQIEPVSDAGTVDVLELGSGPGFLAKHLLDGLPSISRYVALDFSPAMHQLARTRLGVQVARVEFVERSFLQPEWPQGLGKFDFVITLQAYTACRTPSFTWASRGSLMRLFRADWRRFGDCWRRTAWFFTVRPCNRILPNWPLAPVGYAYTAIFLVAKYGFSCVSSCKPIVNR